MVPRARRAAFAVAIAAVPLLAGADVVTDWNTTVTAVTSTGASPPQVRAYALVHAAMHDAVNAIEHRYQPYAVDLKAPAGANVDAAAAAAAHGVLTAILPSQKAAADAALAASLAKIPDGTSKTDGVAAGAQVAAKFLALRNDDGFSAKVDVKPLAAAPGVWQLTPGWPAPLATQWGRMKPMVIAKLSEFDLGGPPPVGSERFARDYNEIKAVGARSSSVRTADQTAVAIFWTSQTLAVWNAVAQAAARAHKLSVPEDARLFALVNIAAYDSTIVYVDQKYRYNFWRPYTAIRTGAGTALAADASWEPLLATPGHPEYPSGHCTNSGAVAEVLRRFFEDDRVDVSFTYPLQFGVTRTWKSFTEIEAEVLDARVWGGIHYRGTDEVSTTIGRKIGEHVVAKALLPVKMAER